MTSLSVRVRYRPVRIGFCVRPDSWDDLEAAIRLSLCLWGGRANPIVVAGDHADDLIQAFHIDCLHAPDVSELQTFAHKFAFLPWPGFEKGLFDNAGEPNFLDISHPVTELHEAHRNRRALTDLPEQYAFYHWQEDDPLRYLLLTTFGGYPVANSLHRDYGEFFKRTLQPGTIELKPEDPVPAQGLSMITPLEISRYRLEWDRLPTHDATYGLYVGEANNFQDVVNYWNLRAAEIELVFFDPTHADRLSLLRDAQVKWIQSLPKAGNRHEEELGDTISVWASDISEAEPLLADTIHTLLHPVSPNLWRTSSIKPPLLHFGSKSVLANVTEDEPHATYSFQLPDKPFDDDVEFHNQQMAVSVRPPFSYDSNADSTFFTPFLPELNQLYGRSAFRPACIRVEERGLAAIIGMTESNLSISSIGTQKLFAELFNIFGFRAEPSLPGRIATRLLRQLGGIQGCRVLKVRGVRRLINNYGPLEPFTKGAALQLIGDVQDGRPNFSDFEGLFIEPRDSEKLTPEQTFNFLADHGVFRVGLNLRCPSCELEFWVTLDDAATLIECEYCGKEFSTLRQLHDRDWLYRRSGLFGKDDHQEGSIPVALTLQQLDTVLGASTKTLFVTAQKLTPLGTEGNSCEIDFAGIVQRGGQLQIVFGECKSGGLKNEITEQDVRNLAALADAFPAEKVEPFIVFSKTGSFSPAEVERCKRAQGNWGRRVILLSDRELEPYYVYERTKREFEIDHIAIKLNAVAKVTHSVFFEPKPRRR